MPKILVKTNFNPIVVAITVATNSPQKICVVAFDATQTTTVFTDMAKTVEGKHTFHVRMPQCGKETEILVYNSNVGIVADGADKTFSIVSVTKERLSDKINQWLELTYHDREFIMFAQQFAYNARIMDSGVYKSKNGNFTIEYLDKITDENGKEIPTSFRVSTTDGTIQASRQKIRNYTLPILLFLLLHEYSHFYKNDDIDNELEADLNALQIYLGLDYPSADVVWGLAITFEGNKTKENEQRWETCIRFIDDHNNENLK